MVSFHFLPNFKALGDFWHAKGHFNLKLEVLKGPWTLSLSTAFHVLLVKIGLENRDFSMKMGPDWMRFESHTFQVNFKSLKFFQLLITHRGIYIHLKLYSGHKKSKIEDLFSEGLPATVGCGRR